MDLEEKIAVVAYTKVFFLYFSGRKEENPETLQIRRHRQTITSLLSIIICSQTHKYLQQITMDDL